MPSNGQVFIPDGSFDFSGGVDSSLVTTLQSKLVPNGLARDTLAWLNNATVRGGGITQRLGWQPLLKAFPGGYWQGGFIYEPDSANPYLVCQVSGILYSILLEPPFSDHRPDRRRFRACKNPADPAVAEMAWFCQGENYLIIQAGDFYTGGAHPAALLEWLRTAALDWDYNGGPGCGPGPE